MNNYICRVAYCEKCFARGMPKSNQWFLLFGSKSNEFHAKKSDHRGVRGFTPHLFVAEKVVGAKVVVFKVCGMVGCGTYLNKENFVKISESEWTKLEMTLGQWNSLVEYKDDEYFLD